MNKPVIRERNKRELRGIGKQRSIWASGRGEIGERAGSSERE